MAYRRGAFILTPPSLPVFFISLVLAILAFVVRYGNVRLPLINPNYVFELLAIAYVVLLIGVLVRRL